MAIKAVVDSLDDVPEQYRDLYTEVNGKFEVTGVEDVLSLSPVKKLKDENGARRIAERKAKEALAPFTTALGERKLEDVVAALDRIPELEAAAAGNLDETKINGIVEGRIKTKLAPVERERDTFRTQLAERDQIIEGYKTKERTRTIHDAVREAIGKAQGFAASALEDALLIAERVFEIDDDGKVVAKDGAGVTPGIDPVVWLTEMQQKRPHWWGPSGGGGAGGNRGAGGGGGGKNPWRADSWNMTEQAAQYRQDPKRAEQMAASAGSRIGASRPPVAKK